MRPLAFFFVGIAAVAALTIAPYLIALYELTQTIGTI